MVVTAALLFLCRAPVAAQTTFVVSNTNDAGAGSLRQAILDANANPGADTIDFNISGVGPHTIQPVSALPTITDPVVIDGTNEPDFAGTPIIELDGTNAGNVHGLNITGPNSTVRGLVINRFALNGVLISGIGASGNAVEGNFIGTDVAGTSALGNSLHGVSIVSAPDNTVGGTTEAARNVISGNSTHGVEIIFEDATGNVVQGNYIGTDVTGTADLGNGQNGVNVDQAPNNTVGGTAAGAGNIISGNDVHGVGIFVAEATNNLVQGNFIGTDVTGTLDLGNADRGVAIFAASNNTIGGTTAAARNIISGNDESGVYITLGGQAGAMATGNLIQGNYIGTDVSGTVAVGNLRGVQIFGQFAGVERNAVGGAVAGAGNLISGNNSTAVLIHGVGAVSNSVEGNLIGTDVTGAVGLGNAGSGVRVSGDASITTVGGTTAGARNVISGNLEGVTFDAAGGNFVQGNYIGTDVTGTSAIGNVVGVLVIGSGNTIGGATTGAGNTIAFNTGPGLSVNSGTGNAILSNSIFSNADLAIDLGDDGVTANDAGDGDTGANDLQNFPSLTSALRGSTTIEGTLNSTPATDLRVEFFSNSVCDPSEHGEGETFLDATDVSTDGNGDASFSVTLAATIADPYVTATATDPNNNTSEFSQCVAVMTDFTVAMSPTSVTVAPGNAATYTVTVSPVGGSLDDAVSLACSGLPSLTSCSFAPASVTPGSNDATSTLTVTTTAPSSSLIQPLDQRTPAPVYALWHGLLWLGLPGLGLVGVIAGKSATKWGRHGLLLKLALVLLSTTIYGACGGTEDSVGPPVSAPAPGTPTGTFTITVTGTSGSFEHATTATLIVQ